MIIGTFALVFAVLEMSAGQALMPVIRSSKPYKTVTMPFISDADVEEAFLNSASTASEKRANEGEGGIIPNSERSPEARHQRLQMVTRTTMKAEDNQEKFEGAADYLISKYRLSPDQATYGLPRVSLAGSPRARAAVAECEAQFRINCVDSKFRTADGSCNNLQNPRWGRSNTCFARLIPANYLDGVSIVRRSKVNGAPLPNPRVISVSLHDENNVNSRQYTHMVMQWGQFLDHDLTFTPMTRAGDSMMMIECCDRQPNQQHPECFRIDLPRDDPFFSQRGVQQDCLNFVRSATCSDCKLGARQQTNQLTAFIDGSNVYGSDRNDTNALRTFRNGELRVQITNAGELLPESNDIQNDQCSRPRAEGICFQAGDGRVNEQPGLTVMHTLWLRQHNRIAREFRKLFPGANDEAIFQETRRLVGAQLQMITYNEFLPVVIGKDYMNYFKLFPGNEYTSYDSNTEPSIVHEFSTAAYRFGHTLIQNVFATIGGQNGPISLREHFFYPFGLYDGDLDPIARGLFQQPAQQFDRHIVEAVTDHLYKERGALFGMDLPALNIQRGRDHGLNPYVDYLDYFFNLKITNFDQLVRVMSRDNAARLSRLYRDVGDIDLFVGGVLENPLPGAVVGPTFGTIIGLQFYHLKFGDRYYFEHGSQSGTFTRNQLNEIREKTTWAQVICANSDAISDIQYFVFQPSGNENQVGQCRQLPDIDFRFWTRN